MSRTGIALTVITVAIVAAAIAVVVLPGKSTAPTEPTPEPPAVVSIPDQIEVTAPKLYSTITSPLIVEGRARGPWYFEASFPIELRDAQGNLLTQGYAEAQGEWMTTEFVSFRSVPLTFPAQPAGSEGTLILRKANASGEPQFDQSLPVPITF